MMRLQSLTGTHTFATTNMAEEDNEILDWGNEGILQLIAFTLVGS